MYFFLHKERKLSGFILSIPSLHHAKCLIKVPCMTKRGMWQQCKTRTESWRTMDPQGKMSFLMEWLQSRSTHRLEWHLLTSRSFSLHSLSSCSFPSLLSRSFLSTSCCFLGASGDWMKSSRQGIFFPPSSSNFLNPGPETTLRGDRAIQFPIPFHSWSFSRDYQQGTN